MGSFKVSLKSSAERELRKLPQDAVKKIISSLEKLQDDPFAFPLEKLSGVEDTYRY